MDMDKLNEHPPVTPAERREAAEPGKKRRYERPELKKLGLLRQLTGFSF